MTLLTYLITGTLTVLLFVAVLLVFIRRSLSAEQRQRLAMQRQDRSNTLNRLSRRFMLVGGGAVVLVIGHFLLLNSLVVDQAAYRQALAQGQISQGTVTATAEPWYTCLGRPSVCAQSISVSDDAGNLVIDKLLLAHGQFVSQHQRVQLSMLHDTYYPTHLKPLSTDGRVARNAFILASVAGLLFLIGLMMRAGLYYLYRD